MYIQLISPKQLLTPNKFTKCHMGYCSYDVQTFFVLFQHFFSRKSTSMSRGTTNEKQTKKIVTNNPPPPPPHLLTFYCELHYETTSRITRVTRRIKHSLPLS